MPTKSEKKKQPRCKHCGKVVKKTPTGYGHKNKAHWTDKPHKAEVTHDEE